MANVWQVYPKALLIFLLVVSQFSGVEAAAIDSIAGVQYWGTYVKTYEGVRSALSRKILTILTLILAT
jgi:hypothetical protein